MSLLLKAVKEVLVRVWKYSQFQVGNLNSKVDNIFGAGLPKHAGGSLPTEQVKGGAKYMSETW